MDPEQGVEPEYLSRNNPAYCWKFFRSISFTDLSRFGVVQPEEKKEVKLPKSEQIIDIHEIAKNFVMQKEEIYNLKKQEEPVVEQDQAEAKDEK